MSVYYYRQINNIKQLHDIMQQRALRGGHKGTDKLCKQGDPISRGKEYKIYSQVNNVSLVIVQSWWTNDDVVQAMKLFMIRSRLGFHCPMPHFPMLVPVPFCLQQTNGGENEPVIYYYQNRSNISTQNVWIHMTLKFNLILFSYLPRQGNYG